MTEAPQTHPPATKRTAATLRGAVAVLSGEAFVVGVLTVWALWAALFATAVSGASAAATVGFDAMFAAILAGLAWALSRRRGWARGPAIVLQMLMIPLGWYMVTGGLPWLGVPVMLVGLAGSGLLLAPSTRTALGLN